jgi:dTDP-4-dehydrorhamnose reductase
MAGTLVFGREGQLARELVNHAGPDWTFLGREAVDLTRPETAADAVLATRPDLVIVAAAYTAVDRAENEEEIARLVNAESPSRIADACSMTGAALINVSTDYVFNGAKPTPYVESDGTSPLNVYGRTKLEGELGVLSTAARTSVVRTAWVYSRHRSNFVKTMLRLARDRPELRVVADQVGSPTSASDLAEALVALGAKLIQGDVGATGVFHYAGAGETSWAGFAEAIMVGAARRGAPAVPVVPISSAEFPTPAARPANSRLACARLVEIGISPRPWREALGLVLDELLLPIR